MRGLDKATENLQAGKGVGLHYKIICETAYQSFARRPQLKKLVFTLLSAKSG